MCGGGITGSRFDARFTYTATDCRVLVNPHLGEQPNDLAIEPRPVQPVVGLSAVFTGGSAT